MRLALSLFALAAALFAQAQENSGVIAGVVRDASTGQPVANAKVWANRGAFGATPGTYVSGIETVTGADGRYAFRSFPPGRHRLDVSAWLDSGDLAVVERYVRLEAGQELASVDFALARMASISGRVLDHNGEPVPKTWVFLIGREYSLGTLRSSYRKFAETNDLGEYTLNLVWPGRSYLVVAAEKRMKVDAVSPAPGKRELRKPAIMHTFYPGTPAVEGAQPWVPRSGEQREGVDIVLLRGPSYCVSGALRGAGGRGPLRFILEPRRLEQSSSRGTVVQLHGVTGPDGRIRICGLPSGEFRLTAYAQPADWAIPPDFFGSGPVDIGDDDVEDLTLIAQPKMEVPGETAWEGGAPESLPPPAIRVWLNPIGRASFSQERSAFEAKRPVPGTFTIPQVLLGEYEVELRDVPDEAYVKDILYGGQSIRHQPLRVGSAIGNASLRIVLGLDGGTVAVRAADREGKPAADVHIVLLPDAALTEAALADSLATGLADQMGYWMSGRLAPGKYHVLAVRAPINKSPERIGQLLRSRSRAKEVEVGPKAEVQVTVEPAEP
ncbi:MAG: carboxypeptidase regulatory-like domain-containing protein [Bryobacterales bacterium]|nr:carboxypeptidase regulatory-like domain-containing protein [Bryobacterales bacterium]